MNKKKTIDDFLKDAVEELKQDSFQRVEVDPEKDEWSNLTLEERLEMLPF